MTDEQRIGKVEMIADLLHEDCDALVLSVTWTGDDGDTMTYSTSRGNAHAVDGLVYDLTVQVESGQDEPDESEQ